MFGKLLGKVLAAPIRVVSAVEKVAVEIPLDLLTGGEGKAPKTTAIDNMADAVQDTCERLDT